MFKKNEGFSIVFLSLILLIVMGCNNSMPDDLEFKEEVGSEFVTLLTSENGKTYFNIYNRLNNTIDFTYRLGETDSIYQATIGVSDNLNVVAIARNDLDPFGYDLYQINSTSVRKKGFIEGVVGQVILLDNILYAIQYNHIYSDIHLYQYDVDDLTKELNTWKIPGTEVSDLKYNSNEKTLYMTSYGEQNTYLSTIKNDVFQEEVIFPEPYSTQLLVMEDTVLISQGQQVNHRHRKYGTIYQFNEGGIEIFTQTELLPAQMITNQEKLFVLSGNVHSPSVEVYDLDSKRKIAHLNMDEQLWGMVPLKEDVYLFTQSGVFGIYNLNIVKFLTYENNKNSKINLNMYHY